MAEPGPFPIELDHVHLRWERVFVELHLGSFCKFQSSFVYGRLNLSTENITIISSIGIRIMPFTIHMLFELFRRRYDMITWQFNLFFLQQVIEDSITFSDVESVAHLILLTFRSQLQARAYEWFRFGPATLFGYTHVDLLGYTHVGLFVVQRLTIIFYHVDVTLVPRLVATHRKVSRLFDSAFVIQSPLQDLANIKKDTTL
jgi:hypothetical protein